jgi:hypothetical protein
LNQLEKASGVGADRLSQFLRGERNLTLTAAEKICSVLGLHLIKEGDTVIPGLEPRRVQKALRDLDAGKGRPLKVAMADLRRRRA